MAAKPDYPRVKLTPVIPKKGRQGRLLDEAHLPQLVPMMGVRPLDTYTGELLKTGRRDCPCGGSIPEGSVLCCEVCLRSAPEVEVELFRLRGKGLAAMRACERGGPVKFKPKAG